MALRVDGSIEFYSDFMETDKYCEPKKPCVDIEIGNRNFFFKFVNEDLEDNKTARKAMDASKLKFSYSRCNLVWKNRIGPTTFIDSDSSEIESFNQVMHRNVSEYVNLYP